MLVELVSTTTPDGLRLDGALHVAAGARVTPYDLALCLHGVQGNFYSSSLLESLATPLAEQGVDVLRVNTRGHDNVTTIGRRWQGAAFEVVDECRLDLLGWLHWARERGYQRVLLLGHSLGAVKALYAAAHETLPSVAGIVALSPPRLAYEHFCAGQDRDRFLEAMTRAQRLVAEGQADTLFLANFPFPLLITAGSYVDKYGPGGRYDFLNFLDQVKVPVLLTFGSLELETMSAFRGIREALAATVNSRQLVQVMTIAGADHNYTDQQAAIASAIAQWLA